MADDSVDDHSFATVIRCAPLVSIDLVLRDPAGRVLVGRRNNEPARGTLFVPGGVIRKNERLDDEFRRILAAETGRSESRSDARLLGVYEHFYDTNRFGNLGYGTHYIALGYELRVPRPSEIRGDDQHGEFRWMTEAELMAAPDVHENTKAYLVR